MRDLEVGGVGGRGDQPRGLPRRERPLEGLYTVDAVDAVDAVDVVEGALEVGPLARPLAELRAVAPGDGEEHLAPRM